MEKLRAFWKTVWGKVCLIGLAAVLLAGIAGGCFGIWHYRQPRFQDVTVELGTTAIDIAQFCTGYARAEKAVFVSDVSQIDIGRTGVTEVTLACGRHEQTVNLTVEDTTPPEVVFCTHRTEHTDYLPDPADFVESVSDLSEVTLSFAQPPVVPDDYSDVTCTVVATDASGNAVRQECTVSFSWLRECYVLELGATLTKVDLLFNPAADRDLLNQADISAVNAGGVGEYTITSTTGGKTAVCTVTVQDTTAPKLELCPVSVYTGGHAALEDFVVSAEDLSGDVALRLLTELDTSREQTLTVVIEAEDGYGNIARGETQLIVSNDSTPPSISGLSAITVDKGAEFIDYMTGVSAWDSKDGACSVTYDASKVDTSKSGYYYVTYTARDKSGNVATARRRVEVRHDAADTNALVAEIAAGLSSDPEAIRDYVRNNIWYSTDWGGSDPIWYGFTEHNGNCYVHALCLQSLLNLKGYQTKLIWVTGKSHYWLLINLNGVWRHIDATPSSLHERYSLMTDAQRLETLSGRVWDFDAWPACE